MRLPAYFTLTLLFTTPLIAVQRDRVFIPIVFEENLGQAEAGVKYLCNSGTATALFRSDSVEIRQGLSTTRVFWGGRAVIVKGGRRLPGHSSYFSSRAGGEKLVGVPHFGSVEYQEIAPGVDLVFYGSGNELEYDVRLAPGAELKEVRFRVTGGQKLELDQEGNLLIRTDDGSVRQKKPHVYSVRHGKAQPVRGSFRLLSADSYGFRVEDYDRSAPLVVDPVIESIGVFGGDFVTQMKTDATGAIYLCGTRGLFVYGTLLTGDKRGVLVKLSADAKSVLYVVYFDGPYFQEMRSMFAVDAAGTAYVLTDPNATKKIGPGGFEDVPIAKLSSDGKSLTPLFVFGGSYTEEVVEMGVDAAGNVVVAGTTQSKDMPTTAGAYQSAAQGQTSGFFARFSPAGELLYSTYLSGNGWDSLNGMALTADGSAVVVGRSDGWKFPVTANALVKPPNYSDDGRYGYVVKFSPANQVVFATYLSKVASVVVDAVALDKNGNIYLAGTAPAKATDFAVTAGSVNEIPMRKFNDQPFVAKLNAAGTAFGYIGRTNLWAYKVQVDATGNLYLVGTMNDPAFPATPGAPLPLTHTDEYSNVNSSGFAAKINAGGTAIDYATLLIPQTSSYARGAAMAPDGSLWVFGTAGPIEATPQALAYAAAGWYLAKVSETIPCSYLVSGAGIRLPASGGTADFSVTAPDNCTWFPDRSHAWMSMTPKQGKGSGTVRLTVGASESPERTGQVSVAGKIFGVTQEDGCWYKLSSTSVSFPANGGTVNVTVTHGAACIVLMSAPSADWIIASVTDTGFTVRVFGLTGSQGRSGTLTVSGLTFTVNQGTIPCTYQVSTLSITVPASGGSGTVNVTAPANCLWMSAVWDSGGGFLFASNGDTRNGNGTFTYEAQANYTGKSRSGKIAVAGQTVVVSQAALSTIFGPAMKSFSPATSTGPFPGIIAAFTDEAGFGNISAVHILINVVNSPTNACYVKYENNAFYLATDDGQSWMGPVLQGAPGSGTFTNGACTLSADGSSVINFEKTLTLKVGVQFKSSFIGKRSVYVNAFDLQGRASGWSPVAAYWPAVNAGTATLWYRLYDPFTSSHHYTTDSNEYAYLGAHGFSMEGPDGAVYNAPNGNAMPYYRIYIIPTRLHFWTTDRNEYLSLIQNRGYYAGEGIDGFLLPPGTPGTKPYYRLLFCCSAAPIHHWTSDANENTSLQKNGWLSEGVSGYLLASSAAIQQAPAEIAIHSGGSLETGAIAPGQIIHIRGRDLRNAQVSIGGMDAQVIARSDSEVQAIVPEEIGGMVRAKVFVTCGKSRQVLQTDVAAARPALFGTDPFGKGQAYGVEGPVQGGDIITIHATGLGKDLPVAVWVGGSPAAVQTVVTRNGRSEIRVKIPEGLASSSSAELTLRAGEFSSQSGVTVAIR